MRKVWVIAADEYKTNIRRTGFIVMTLIVPLIGLIALLISAFVGGKVGQFFTDQMEGQARPVGVVDEYGAFTPILADYVAEYKAYASEDAARVAILSKEINTAMVIPSDYLERGVIRVLSSDSTLGTLDAVSEERTRGFLTAHLLRGQVDDKLYSRLQNPMKLERVELSQATGASGRAQSVGETVSSVLIPYFLGILLVMSIFTSSGYLMQSVTEEKSNRVIEIVLSSVSAHTLLAGKIMGMGALGLTQILVWLASATALSLGSKQLTGVALPIMNQPMLYVFIVIYFLLGYMIYAVLMGIAGSLGTTQQESQQISSLLSLLAAVPFFFASFVIQNPNAGVVRVLSYIPFTSPTMMLLRIPLGQPPVIDYVVSILVTALCIPLLLKAGAKVFRMGLLVYGKRPSMAVIWKAIKES
ncbi:MAG: ABC transporter permease [Chloroflexi bacterium]|nr:ABC transporter permease [Chloroflexota bacterium]